MNKSNVLSTQSAGNAVQRGVESAGAALHQGIDMLAGPVRSTVEIFSSSAHQSVASLAGSASHAAERVVEEARKVTEAPAKALRYSRTSVQNSPLQAVGIALAVGFLLGRLTAR